MCHANIIFAAAVACALITVKISAFAMAFLHWIDSFSFLLSELYQILLRWCSINGNKLNFKLLTQWIWIVNATTACEIDTDVLASLTSSLWKKMFAFFPYLFWTAGKFILFYWRTFAMTMLLTLVDFEDEKYLCTFIIEKIKRENLLALHSPEKSLNLKLIFSACASFSKEKESRLWSRIFEILRIKFNLFWWNWLGIN